MKAHTLIAAAIGALATALVPTTGLSHSGGSTELLAQLVLHPRDPNVLVARYEAGSSGLLYSDDGAQSFRMLCASAIDDAANRGTHIALGGDGAVLLGSFTGVLADDGAGCAWSDAPELRDLWVRAMAPHPGDPDATLAVTSTGSEGAMNALAMRSADGSWQDLGERTTALLTSVAATLTGDGSLRVYTTAEGEPTEVMIEGKPETIRQCMIRVSDDAGATWSSSPCPLTTGSIGVAAVDPGDPDRIVLSEHNEDGADHVWVSDDRGATLRQWMELSDFGAIAFDGDGRVWVGDWGDAGSPAEPRGLLRAESLDATPEVVADYPVHCLAYEPTSDTLFACQRFWIGTVDPATAEFSTSFSLEQTTDFVECDGGDTAGACETELCGAFCGPGSFAEAEVCEAYDGPSCGPCAIGEAAARPDHCDAPAADDDPDAMADAGSDGASDAGGGCGCRIAGDVPPTGIWGWLLAAAALVRLRRSRRPNPAR